MQRQRKQLLGPALEEWSRGSAACMVGSGRGGTWARVMRPYEKSALGPPPQRECVHQGWERGDPAEEGTTEWGSPLSERGGQCPVLWELSLRASPEGSGKTGRRR